jgi:hypothetical protein
MANKLKVGLIGLGGIMKGAHMPGYARMDDVEITAICDIVPEKIEAFKAQFGMPDVASFTDYNELIAKVEKDEMNRYILKAVGVGTCRVTFLSPSREIVKELVVTVKSALTESNSGILHNLTWFGIYSTILALIPWKSFLPIVSMVLIAAHVVFAVLGVILKFKSDDETRYKVYNVIISAISLLAHFFML